METVNCPACAGPTDQRLGCATCGGTLVVPQKIYDEFILRKERQEKHSVFLKELNDLLLDSADKEITIKVGQDTLVYLPE